MQHSPDVKAELVFSVFSLSACSSPPPAPPTFNTCLWLVIIRRFRDKTQDNEENLHSDTVCGPRPAAQNMQHTANKTHTGNNRERRLHIITASVGAPTGSSRMFPVPFLHFMLLDWTRTGSGLQPQLALVLDVSALLPGRPGRVGPS